MPDRWGVEVDAPSCLGSGICTSMAAGRFALDDKGRSHPVDGQIDADPAVIDAAESCPAEAIIVTDLATGTVLAGPE
ncbi:ferredoxin [Pseudonocardia sp. GCM10023141]|uniref:ferredoxin n=1 Tax=Pseudonocardia sp. GCM10023141 TaxID=3252653 RepID=UPI0036156319